MMSSRTELMVKDIEQSVDFYVRVLGFTRNPSPNGWISVSNGTVNFGFGFISNLPSEHPLAKKSPDERTGVGVELVLEVDDVESYFERVKQANYPISRELGKRDWGLTDFRIVDPDGYYLRITSKN